MSWTSTAAYTGPTKIVNGILVRDDGSTERLSHGRTHDTAERLHVYLHRPRRSRVRDDVRVTPSMPPADPDDRKSGQQPKEAGFRDKGEGEATCVFRRDRSGMWRGEDRAGRRWRANENGGVLYVYPDDGDDDVAGGGIVNPIDPRSADQRRAGDRVLATPGAGHDGPDQIEGLRSWQAKLNRFWAR
jgi:hypothetical protein